MNVSGVTLNTDKLSLNAGETFNLVAKIQPDNASDKVVLWTSSNPLVASVDKNGVVTALSDGTAEITAKTLENSNKQFKAVCKVDVTGTIEPVGTIIEAEDCSINNDCRPEECAEGGKDIAYIKNDSYLVFKNINFGRGTEKLNFRISTYSNDCSVEVRLGAPDGKLIGTMNVASTGGWQNWQTQKCNIEKTSGTNDVYLVFKGGDGYLFNLNWWSIKYLNEDDPVLGDCNLDGKFDVADVVILQKWLLAVPDTHLANWKAADLCEDDSLNVFDLCLMKRMLIEKS